MRLVFMLLAELEAGLAVLNFIDYAHNNDRAYAAIAVIFVALAFANIFWALEK